jgi:hypothetical protein
MKNLRFLAVFAALVFAMSIGAQAQWPPLLPCCPPPDAVLECYNTDPTCRVTGVWNSAQIVILLPEFPNCPITLDYCWRDCQNIGSHYEQIYICRYTYDCLNPNYLLCEFIDEDPDLTEERLEELHSKSREKLIQIKFASFYNTLSTEEKEDYRCPSLFGGDIDWDNVRYKVSFIEGSCNSLCKGLRTIGNKVHIVSSKQSCSPGFCCKITTQLCIDQNGILWMLTTKDDQDGAPACAGLPLPQCPQYEELIQFPCKSNCEPY